MLHMVFFRGSKVSLGLVWIIQQEWERNREMLTLLLI